MSSPDSPTTDLVNSNLQQEKQYDHHNLATIIENSEPFLTVVQKMIYERIMLAFAAEQAFFFLGDRWNRQDISNIVDSRHSTITTENPIDSRIVWRYLARLWANCTINFQTTM